MATTEIQTETTPETPLAADELRLLDAYWRAANYLAVGQIYLLSNPLLRVPDGPVLAAADLREGQSLDGEWTYSIDPYQDGAAGFHGAPAGEGQRRYDDIDVERGNHGPMMNAG